MRENLRYQRRDVRAVVFWGNSFSLLSSVHYQLDPLPLYFALVLLMQLVILRTAVQQQ